MHDALRDAHTGSTYRCSHQVAHTYTHTHTTSHVHNSAGPWLEAATAPLNT
jgi:hypothetical protein